MFGYNVADSMHYTIDLSVSGDEIVFGDLNEWEDSETVNGRSSGYYQPMIHDDEYFIIAVHDHHATFDLDGNALRQFTDWDHENWDDSNWVSGGSSMALPERVEGNRLLMLDSGLKAQHYVPRLALFPIEDGLIGPTIATFDPGDINGNHLEPKSDLGFVHQISETRWLACCMAWEGNYAWFAPFVWLVDISGDAISIIDTWQGSTNHSWGNGAEPDDLGAPWEILVCRAWGSEWWITHDDMNDGEYNAFALRRIGVSGDSIVPGQLNQVIDANAGRELVFSPGLGHRGIATTTYSTSGDDQDTHAFVMVKDGDAITVESVFSLKALFLDAEPDPLIVRDAGIFGHEPLGGSRWLFAMVLTEGLGGDHSKVRLQVGLFDIDDISLLDMATPMDKRNDGYFHVSGRYVLGDAIVAKPVIPPPDVATAIASRRPTIWANVREARAW